MCSEAHLTKIIFRFTASQLWRPQVPLSHGLSKSTRAEAAHWSLSSRADPSAAGSGGRDPAAGGSCPSCPTFCRGSSAALARACDSPPPGAGCPSQATAGPILQQETLAKGPSAAGGGGDKEGVPQEADDAVPWALRIRGRKALVTRMAPHRLTSATLWYFSTLVNSTSPKEATPALFTKPHRPVRQSRRCVLGVLPQEQGPLPLGTPGPLSPCPLPGPKVGPSE